MAVCLKFPVAVPLNCLPSNQARQEWGCSSEVSCSYNFKLSAKQPSKARHMAVALKYPVAIPLNCLPSNQARQEIWLLLRLCRLTRTLVVCLCDWCLFPYGNSWIFSVTHEYSPNYPLYREEIYSLSEDLSSRTGVLAICSVSLITHSIFEPPHEKACLRGFQPAETQPELLSFRS